MNLIIRKFISPFSVIAEPCLCLSVIQRVYKMDVASVMAPIGFVGSHFEPSSLVFSSTAIFKTGHRRIWIKLFNLPVNIPPC